MKLRDERYRTILSVFVGPRTTAELRNCPSGRFRLEQIATAAPRRLANHSEMSAITGPKLAEVPPPISSPSTSVNRYIVAAWLARPL